MYVARRKTLRYGTFSNYLIFISVYESTEYNLEMMLTCH